MVGKLEEGKVIGVKHGGWPRMESGAEDIREVCEA